MKGCFSFLKEQVNSILWETYFKSHFMEPQLFMWKEVQIPSQVSEHWFLCISFRERERKKEKERENQYFTVLIVFYCSIIKHWSIFIGFRELATYSKLIRISLSGNSHSGNFHCGIKQTRFGFLIYFLLWK